MKGILLAIPLLTLAAEVSAQTAADRATATTRGNNPRFRNEMPGGSLIRDVSTQRVPELYPGELQDVGPQFLVARPDGSDGKGGTAPPPRPLFEGFADAQLFYTSNALLTEKGNQDTGVLVLTLQAAINLPQFELAGGTLSPRVGYRHQWWLYSLDNTANQLNNFDFAVGTLFLGFRHSWNEVWVASFSLDYNRYLSLENDNTEFYVELAPNWALERNIPLGEKAQLTVGYYGAWHWTQTDPQPVSNINDRLDSTLGLTYTQEILPKLYLQPYYRLQWSHYSENSNRNDLYNSLGIGLVYAFNNWASIRAFVSYENRNSSDDTVSDYNKWDSGGGVTFSAQF